ncbi:MAG TPA: FUSC family protein [Bryobacteraceae bacterium]|jgi:multidrug resistance protein MdtO|nr:FUSC family protein [Bryobacteraceae bacterium]
MATLVQRVPPAQRVSRWLWEFLREELAPYPGRMALIARMMVAATVVMIITMTFRIPQGAYAALYALNISRESPRATVAAVKTIAVAFVIAAAYDLIGATFFVSEPTLRLVWVIATFFLMFYSLVALTNYTAGVRFGYLVAITTPIWDRHVSAEAKVEDTLWAVWAITLATIITTVIELVYAELSQGSDLIRPMAERLSSVEEILISYAEGQPIDEATENNITRLTMVGTSRLRRNLQRSSYSAQYREQMGAVLALVSRLVDIAGNLVHLDLKVPDVERGRTRNLAQTIAGIRADLERGVVVRQTELHRENETQSAVPLLREIETTVSLIPEAFVGSQSLSAYAPSPPGHAPRAALFRPDALSNFDYIKFGLKGCLAASLCYIIYNLIDWPGISTAVTTCLVTALSTIGSSRQKQLLRIAGAIAGGVVLGIGTQVFILPYLDSIADFTILFLGVTFVAAWFGSSSARLSYFGNQMALGFYLINLQEFKIQTSLAVARDRVVGILLGLFIMWLVFDQLWGAPAAVEMKRTFISNLRLLARFAREPLSPDQRTAIERSFTLRETINNGLDKARALADGVLFEFGRSREQDLALRNRIRQWQTQLRMLFIIRIALFKYRMRLPGFELPEGIWQAQGGFDDELAKTLDAMADRFEGKPAARESAALEARFRHLEQAIQMFALRDSQREVSMQLDTFLTLSRRAEQLATSLNWEV